MEGFTPEIVRRAGGVRLGSARHRSRASVEPAASDIRIDSKELTDTLRTVGLVLAGIGLVPMVVGLVLYLPASKTTVVEKPAPQPTPHPLAAWREVGAPPRAANGAPPATFPLLWSMSF